MENIKMKKLILSVMAIVLTTAAMAQSKVYVTRDISPESLVKYINRLVFRQRGVWL